MEPVRPNLPRIVSRQRIHALTIPLPGQSGPSRGEPAQKALLPEL
jgi:hypothetical protein